MLADFFHDVDSLWWFFGFGQESERFVECDGIRIAHGNLERAEFAVTADIRPKASGRGEYRLASRGMIPKLAREREIFDRIGERYLREVGAGRYTRASRRSFWPTFTAFLHSRNKIRPLGTCIKD